MSSHRCVIVVDPTLPTGLLANTSAVLALSLGRAAPGLIGADLVNQRGDRHQGITTLPIPILQADAPTLARLREQLRQDEPALTVIDLIDATCRTRSYEEYAAALAATPVDALQFHGLGIYGPNATVKRHTGSLALLR
jgi:hypothetical protein